MNISRKKINFTPLGLILYISMTSWFQLQPRISMLRITERTNSELKLSDISLKFEEINSIIV